MPTSPSRRLVLAALAATAVAGTAGCSTPWGDLRVQPLGGDPPPVAPEPGPDELARRAAVAGVSAVLAELDGAPLDAARVAALRTALGEQLTALGAPVPSGSSTPSSSPTGSPTSSASLPDGVAVDMVALLVAAAEEARAPLDGVLDTQDEDEHATPSQA